jgi:predicted phage terminase large subunit-like protein
MPLAKSVLNAGKIPKGAESGDKLTRFSAQCRAGNLKILRGLWNEDLFRVLEGFADLAHDDEVDVTSG